MSLYLFNNLSLCVCSRRHTYRSVYVDTIVAVALSWLTALIFPANGRKHLQTACQTSLAI